MTDSRLISFHVGDCDFAVPLSEIREIVAAVSVTPVPDGRLPLEGLMVYRGGQALPVFSLLGALGRDSESGGSLIVVSELGPAFVGFRVEGIGGVVDGVQGDRLDEYHGELKGRAGAIEGTFESGDRSMIVLSLSAVFQEVVR
ncbi:MAG TPA: chemotaxis protein CheW [Proteobacteria bacterium]|nr:chemotaxis protein CheV [bacterium BMS3Abin14]HDL52869.1 chemotaxis protein CheW [Pseudomonadota bacterium]